MVLRKGTSQTESLRLHRVPEHGMPQGVRTPTFQVILRSLLEGRRGANLGVADLYVSHSKLLCFVPERQNSASSESTTPFLVP
jgi:hypothetical protein